VPISAGNGAASRSRATPLARQHHARAVNQRDARALHRCALFFELALEDLTAAAALFRPIHHAPEGRDGWVSLDVSPLLANDTATTIEQASHLHERAAIPTLLIKIPGTPPGPAAIEDTIARHHRHDSRGDPARIRRSRARDDDAG
jgi:transaldolase